ncbi:MAG: nucleotidyltransferase domain-containing protein [Solirubrobacteraceae bacterium]
MTQAEIIEEIRIRLGAAVPPRSKVLLFGSHARDEAVADSDYDVLVIEPQVEDRVEESARLRRELRGLGVPIDIVVMDEATMKRRAVVAGTLADRAQREGRVLVDA